MIFRSIVLAFLALASSASYAEPVVPTPSEEEAFLAGMQGMMERLADPNWIKLMAENEDGCWLDKNTLVKVGEEIEFKGVPSRCVPLEVVPGPKAYVFMPIRIVELCDKAQKPYGQCVE